MFWWFLLCAIVCFCLGGWLWPKVKLGFIHLRADPVKFIKEEIAELEAIKRRLIGHTGGPINPPGPTPGSTGL